MSIPDSLPEVIFLNGPSRSGKTSIARTLQDRLPDPFARLGVDDVVFPLAPPRWHGVDEGLRFKPHPEGGLYLHMGENGMVMQHAFHRVARAMVTPGLGLIIDEVLVDPRLLPHWLEVLADLEVFFVGVHCDLAELEQRERVSPDRAQGHVRTHHRSVHRHGLYDLEIDTTEMNTTRCAARIAEALATRPRPTAFERLRADTAWR